MIHYIETSTADDFIKSEVAEHGWDYVEAQFELGYEPAAHNGVWIWKVRANVCLRLVLPASNVSSSTGRNSLPNRSDRVLALNPLIHL